MTLSGNAKHVYLIFKVEFPTDYDGELVAAYLDKELAESWLRQLNDDDCYIKEVKLDD